MAALDLDATEIFSTIKFHRIAAFLVPLGLSVLEVAEVLNELGAKLGIEHGVL